MSRPSDIVVVGAGIVGCAVAYELARRGASVQVLDDRPAGMGATQASAGVLAPYIEAREGSPLLELTVRSLALFDDFVARAASESGVAVMYRRNGTIDVGMNEAEMASLQKTADILARRGVPALMLDAACDAVPHAWSAGFKGARVGLRPATADNLPVIGASRAAPHVMYATGHYRNGVLLAPLTARLVADVERNDPQRLRAALEALADLELDARGGAPFPAARTLADRRSLAALDEDTAALRTIEAITR